MDYEDPAAVREASRADSKKVQALSGADIEIIDGHPELNELAIGAFWAGLAILRDDLWEDIKTLTLQEFAPRCSDVSGFEALQHLPEAFAVRYDLEFARSFLTATIELTARFTLKEWIRPRSTAEELVVHLALTQAAVYAETFEFGLPDGWESQMQGELVEDEDFLFLYTDGEEAGALVRTMEPGNNFHEFENWFEPFWPHMTVIADLR